MTHHSRGELLARSGPKRRRHRRRIRAWRRVLTAAGIVVGFALALVFWAGRPSHAPAAVGFPHSIPTSGHFGGALPTPSSAPAVGVASPTVSASDGRALAHSPKPSLPNSPDADPGGLPVRSIRISVTSDGEIAAVGYVVADGNKRRRYSAADIKTPFVVQATGRSTGLVVEVLAESASNASYITCTLSVDGTQRSHRTVRRPKVFTACLG